VLRVTRAHRGVINVGYDIGPQIFFEKLDNKNEKKIVYPFEILSKKHRNPRDCGKILSYNMPPPRPPGYSTVVLIDS
jgi:hypothetical protein